MRLSKTDVIDLDAFTETCKDCIIARQEKRIAELEDLLYEAVLELTEWNNVWKIEYDYYDKGTTDLIEKINKLQLATPKGE